MYKNLTKIPTRDMPHDIWLEHRRLSIGGSDASAIIGLNPWASPYSVWADKLGKLPPKEDTEAMRLGRDLEGYVARRFTEATGKKVRRENYIIVNPDYPFAHANVDRMVVGEDAGLECKVTSSLNTKKFKNGEYPDNYYVQCVHYLMVTGCQRWYLSVLVLGQGFYRYTIERDEEEIAALAKSEEDFWKLVESKTPPMADGLKATSDAISTLYPTSLDDNSIDLLGYESVLQQYMALTAQIKQLDALKEEMANKVKAFLGEAGKGESDNYRVTYTSTERLSFDSKKFAQANPGIDLSAFYKKSTYRTFKVTEKK